jgi:hypothetical protein
MLKASTLQSFIVRPYPPSQLTHQALRGERAMSGLNEKLDLRKRPEAFVLVKLDCFVIS